MKPILTKRGSACFFDKVSTMSKHSYHVVSRIGGKWAVRKEDSARASSTHASKDEAVARGKAIARKEGTELIIHGRDGRIRDMRSYGNDPAPPRDKRA